MRACATCTSLVTAALSCILISSSQQPAHGWQFPDAEPIEGARKGVKPPEFSPKQWRVNTTGGLLTIFMPVIPTEMELGYARNQLRTFERLFDLSTIREWMIVTPPDHVEDVRAFFHSRDLLDELPHFNESMFRVVHDGECAPELMPGTDYSETPKQWKGWIRQQLVKLSCARLMHTPFYLIMDSDVFVARPMTALNLFETAPCDASSVVCDTEGETSYRCANDCYPTSQAQEFHKNWWRNSAETLQLVFPLEWDAALGVTPQILSTDISLGLGKFIQERFGVEQWGAFLLDAYAAKHIKNWEERQYLGHDPAWTEYSIYFIFAQHARAFERYHAVGKILQWNAIWEQDQWEKWDACKDTFEWDWGYLGLVQSRLKLPPQAIWAKMKACWDEIDARPKPPPPPVPPPPVLVYEQPKAEAPPEKPKEDPDASLGISQPYSREGNTFSELLARNQTNGTAADPPPGVHVNLQKGKKGASSSSSKLQGPLGKAPPLTDPMEQHLFELATGGSTALEHLHNERAGSNATLTRGTPALPVNAANAGLPEGSAAAEAAARKGSAGLSRNQAGSLHKGSAADLPAAMSNPSLSEHAAGTGSHHHPEQQQQQAGGLRPPPSVVPEPLKQHPGRLAGQATGDLKGSQGSDTTGRSKTATTLPSETASETGTGLSSMTSKPGGKVLPGAESTDAVHQKGHASGIGSSKSSELLKDSSGGESSSDVSGRGQLLLLGKAKAAGKDRIPPSERASNARLSRAEARRQTQARRLEAAGVQSSSS